MKIIPSVCTNLWFPESRKNIEVFRATAVFLADRGIQCVEYYHDGEQADEIGAVLSMSGLGSVLIGVIPLKEQKLSLSSTDAARRNASVALSKQLMQRAESSGASSLMLCSGKIELGRESESMSALMHSIEELYNERIQRKFKLRLELEPCDSQIDARQFVGPYERASALCDMLRDAGVALHLTMDTAHTAEEGQNFDQAIHAVKRHCEHVHYANCFLKDAQHPLYGDKHLGYEYPDTEWGFDALEALTKRLNALYENGDTLMIGLEALCREVDPFAYFDAAWARMPYLMSTKE